LQSYKSLDEAIHPPAAVTVYPAAQDVHVPVKDAHNEHLAVQAMQV